MSSYFCAFSPSNRIIKRIRNNFDPGQASRKGAGIGLDNVRNRLTLIYARDELLTVKKKENIFEVILLIPQN